MLANPLKEIVFYKYKIVPGVAAVDFIVKLTLWRFGKTVPANVVDIENGRSINVHEAEEIVITTSIS